MGNSQSTSSSKLSSSQLNNLNNLNEAGNNLSKLIKGNNPLPLSGAISIEPTYRCNLNFEMCFYSMMNQNF